MTKNEALKAAIDGKKLTSVFWNGSYFAWDENKMEFFGVQSSGKINPTWNIKEIANISSSDWEIVPEYVDFAEAWKAYEDGKRIRSVASECEWLKSTVGSAYHSFSTTEIRGKWLILEDK